jgi:hypothetical protein
MIDRIDLIDAYKGAGILTTPLVLDALLAVIHCDEYDGKGNIREERKTYYYDHLPIFRRVYRDITTIDATMRLAEIAVWFGRPDIATWDTVEASRKFAQSWRPGAEFGLEMGETALKAYYDASNERGHRSDVDGFVCLLWGGGGRVLITIKDELIPDVDLTIILDESSECPRGGIQSINGSKDQCLDLLERFRTVKHQFKPDTGVTFG